MGSMIGLLNAAIAKLCLKRELILKPHDWVVCVGFNAHAPFSLFFFLLKLDLGIFILFSSASTDDSILQMLYILVA